MTFANFIINFFNNLKAPELNNDIEALNPYEKEEVKEIVKCFYHKYFDDTHQRVFIIGINPGRFGGGMTGIGFTDPVALRDHCGIENNLGNKTELSSKFIYTMIKAYGGPEKFYSRFYLTALYPLAIIKNGKNYNYYDEPQLYHQLKSAIVSSIKDQVNGGAKKEVAICLGKKNYEYLKKINDEYKIFSHLKVLEHPRYIMQYKLKQLPSYVNQYLETFSSIEF